jgi:hypothetical protein
MPLGALPQNQLDALPLQTMAQATAPSSVLVVGKKLTKYWAPTGTGISGTMGGDPDDGVGSAIFGNWLDVTGCNEFMLLLVITILTNAGRESAITTALNVQYRTPNGLVLPHSGNVGTTMFTSPAGRTPDMSAFLPQPPYSMSFGWANPGGGVSLGWDMRLWLRSTVGHNPNQLWEGHLWAAGS